MHHLDALRMDLRTGRHIFELRRDVSADTLDGSSFSAERHSADTAGLRHTKSMNQESNSEAAETVQTTNVPAVDLPRLVLPSFECCGYPHPWSDKKCNREKGHGGEHACIEHYSGRQNEWWKGKDNE